MKKMNNKEKPEPKVSPIDKKVKTCIHEDIIVNNYGDVVRRLWVFSPDRYVCGKCNLPNDVVFMRTSPLNKVIQTCEWANCKVSQCVEYKNSKGLEMAEHLQEYDRVLTDDEVRDFVKRNKMQLRFLNGHIAAIIEKRNIRRRKVDNI